MKKIILFLSAVFFALSAVTAQSTKETLAQKIAEKLKDSLSLSNEQKNQIYTINIDLSDQKASVRQQYTGDPALEGKIQAIERTRDSLYRPVLGEEKFLLYRQKKRNLVNNN